MLAGEHSHTHEYWMRLALAQARRALAAGEVPVGAVVVSNEQVVGSGFNAPILTSDPTAHAEVCAVRAAAAARGNYRLAPGSTLYVTVEPCVMCAGALVHARVSTLVYGACEPKAGAVVSAMRALDHPALNHRVQAIGGILEDDCRALMREFFRSRRSSPIAAAQASN